MNDPQQQGRSKGIPDGSPGPATVAAQRLIRNVELSGRLTRCWTMAAAAGWVVLVLGLCWSYSWAAFWCTAMPAVLGGAAVFIGGMAGVRWWAYKATCAAWGMKPDGALTTAGTIADVVAPESSGGTIICCSGGGIKSASFCLGALQALDEAGLYHAARAVVGVSGGGYIAAAYAAQQYRKLTPWTGPAPAGPPDDGTVFTERSPELAALRRRTNYLASSTRVGLDLAFSLLFGLAINLLIVAAVISMLAWLIAEQVRLTDLVGIDGSSSGWVFNSADLAVITLLRGPAVLIVLAVLLFLISRYLGAQRRYLLANPARWRIFRRSPRSSGAEPMWNAWFSNAPNSLVMLAVVITVLYPGVPVVACLVHNFWATHSLADWAGTLQLTTVLAVIGGFATLVRSAMKGADQVGHVTAAGQVLLLFRLQVAPRLGVALAAAAGYAVLVEFTAPYLSSPDTEHGALLWRGLGFLILARVFASANKTSMFPFYRNRLEFAFFRSQPVDDHRPDASAASGVTGEKNSAGQDPAAGHLPGLADLVERGQRPELVLCATANVRDGDLLPCGRNGTPFILSSLVGFTDPHLPGGDYRLDVRAYRPGGGLTLDVATAAAISGAAVAPLAGRDKGVRAYRLLLALANVRLGVWIRNPYWTSDVGGRPWIVKVNDVLDKASPYQVVQEALGTPTIYDPHLYVTDGGHYDNLGLVEALRRRPDRIILLDGSGDPEDQFPAMGDAIATARMDLGIEVDFHNPARLQRGSKSHPSAGWMTTDATYPTKPDGSSGGGCRIAYVKCVLPAGLSWDLQSYQLRDPEFPTTSTKYELYTEFDFEAYRRLGWSLVHDAESNNWTDREEAAE